ncbi:cytochrome P450 [Streptomyces sp. PTM05]|uniref:Cytochrome P450 n=1 Tax=Streptantibioticus parmotrematis TaxID=2873249 RepID=A0ABS7QV12_9ACTN|nr:cytochrome P450 [Streptantibioticus parmotrematis]MBY8887047.1 cytochrome P450 [Streptantibioticus parmotrematis]
MPVATDAMLRAPRVPGGLPFVGHAVSLLKEPLAFLDAQRPLGELVEFRIGRRPAYIVNHPELVLAVLAGPAGRFTRGEIFAKARPLFGQGVVVADGIRHRDRRRALQPLLSAVRLPGYLSTLAELVSERVASWSDGQTVDLNAEMTDLTLNAVAATILGHPLPPRSAETVHRALPIVVSGLARRAYGPAAALLDRLPGRERAQYRAALADIHRVVDALITADESSPALRQLAGGVDVDQLHDDVTSLLIGGSHTTAAAAAWIFILLSRYPQVRSRIKRETGEVLGSRPVTSADLPNLVLTRRVVQETLRLFPPVWLFPRRAVSACDLGGHHVEAGTQVFYSPYSLHRDPRWFPRATSFDPDRWDPERHPQPPRGAYLPFAAGVHGCPGGDFALGELTLLAAAATARCRLDPVLGSRTTPVPAATLGPGPVKMIVNAHP